MLAELRVVVKDDESTLSKKFLHYTETDGDIVLNDDSLAIRKVVDQTVHEFGKMQEEISNIIVNIKIIWE